MRPALLLAVVALACAAPPDAPPHAARSARADAAPSAAVPPSAPLTDAAAQDTLARVIAEYRLTTLPRACYTFEPDGGVPYQYTVREVHNARCGGDPHFAPRIVGVRLDTATGAVLSDAGPAIRGDDGQDGAGMDTVRRASRGPQRGAPRR